MERRENQDMLIIGSNQEAVPRQTPASGLPTAAAATGAGSSAAAAADSSVVAAAGAGRSTTAAAAAAGLPVTATATLSTTPTKEHSQSALQVHLEAPSAAVTPAAKVTDHPHDDPSPTSDQPATKQKTGAGIAAAKPRAGTAAAAAAAAATAAGTAVGRLPTCSQQGPDLHSAADWLHSGSGFVRQLMKNSGVGGMLELGNACSIGLDALETAGRLRRVGYKEEQYSSRSVSYKVLCLLDFEGRDTQDQQWKQQADELPTLLPSSVTAAGDQEAFEASRAHPAVLVELSFQKSKKHKQWFIVGGGLGVKLKPDHFEAAELPFQLPSNAYFKALFDINVVVMLMWHAEGKQQPPELQRIHCRYRILPKKRGQREAFRRPVPAPVADPRQPQEATMSDAAASDLRRFGGLPRAFQDSA